MNDIRPILPQLPPNRLIGFLRPARAPEQRCFLEKIKLFELFVITRVDRYIVPAALKKFRLGAVPLILAAVLAVIIERVKDFHPGVPAGL